MGKRDTSCSGIRAAEEALKNWCMWGFHLSEAAARMHLHRNTIRYRLEKMQESAPLAYDRNLVLNGDEGDLDALFHVFCVLGRT